MTPRPTGVTGTAGLSPDGRYRYLLTRAWPERNPNPEPPMIRNPHAEPPTVAPYPDPWQWAEVGRPAEVRATFVMLNPSTADADTDDPTIRRIIGYARRWGYDGVNVVNMWAYRATNPADLPASIEARQGPDNTAWLGKAFAAARRCGGIVVAAWGVHGSPVAAAKIEVHARSHEVDLYCFGRSGSGAPLHPLYQRADAALERWRA